MKRWVVVWTITLISLVYNRGCNIARYIVVVVVVVVANSEKSRAKYTPLLLRHQSSTNNTIRRTARKRMANSNQSQIHHDVSGETVFLGTVRTKSVINQTDETNEERSMGALLWTSLVRTIPIDPSWKPGWSMNRSIIHSWIIHSSLMGRSSNLIFVYSLALQKEDYLNLSTSPTYLIYKYPSKCYRTVS